MELLGCRFQETFYSTPVPKSDSLKVNGGVSPYSTPLLEHTLIHFCFSYGEMAHNTPVRIQGDRGRSIIKFSWEGV